MKKILILAVIAYFIGLIAKFFHLPFNAILMLVALVVILVSLTLGTIKKKFTFIESLIGFSSALWLLQLLFVLKFWPFTTIILIFATLLTIITLYVSYARKDFKMIPILLICCSISIGFKLLSSDMRYYIISIHWNHEIQSDFYSWDKYSWFLYQNGKFDEALEASNRALSIVEESRNARWSQIIKTHNSKISQKNWKHYQ